ncbi:unnamed protein product [Rotaria sp. Silwood2]|nr:unnamed protein product [Rotaria sp. Silwood2]
MFQQEAKQAGKEKLLLTCATAAARHRIEAGYEVEEVCKYFDFVSVMTYDYHGSWEGKTGHNSPLYGMRNERKKFREWNIKGSMNVWVELGCPKEKLNIGRPYHVEYTSSRPITEVKQRRARTECYSSKESKKTYRLWFRMNDIDLFHH